MANLLAQKHPSAGHSLPINQQVKLKRGRIYTERTLNPKKNTEAFILFASQWDLDTMQRVYQGVKVH